MKPYFEPQSTPSSSNSLPDLHNFKHNVRQAWYPHKFVALMGVDPIDAGTGAAASGVHVSRRRRQHGTEGPPATGRCMRVGVLLPAFFKHSGTAEASTVFALQSSGDCCDTKHRWIRKQHATHQNTTSATSTQKETQSTRNKKQSNKDQRTLHEINPPQHIPKCRIFNSFANCFCFSMSSNLWCSRPMQCSNTCGTTTFIATDVATSILSCHRATYSM
jgi:hypothetical protein